MVLAMKRLTKSILEKNPTLSREFPARLSELEGELRVHTGRKAGERALKAIEDLKEALIEGQQVVQFSVGKKHYAAGRADVTYPGSNHARGVRHIRFYATGQTVLEIEGDFEDQQLGSNFRFQNMKLYVPGEWESDFMKLTETLREHISKRKTAFKKKRDAERDRLYRGR